MGTQPPPLVLVAESSEEIRAELVRRLGERGHRVAGTGDGAAALALVEREAPDVVLLDHELPGEDGIVVLDRLREHDELAAVPVIMLTRSTDPELLVEALRRGAHDYLRKPFDPAELDARVVAALRVKRLHDALLEANRRLARQALSDDLTGLANRRHGGRQLEREIALCVRHGRLLALVRVDVDHFKAINDSRGHQAGDEVLVEVSRRLAEAVRGGDELARWGGDEFVALFPNTDPAGAALALDKARVALRSERLAAPDGDPLEIGLSGGVADVGLNARVEDAVAEADRFLYLAKGAGRNRVVSRADEGAPPATQ
jgi:two-component system, cell cycle response regulator